MHVRMKVRIGGTRNGEKWPDVGEAIELPDHEAADMIANGYAEEATENAEPADESDGSTTDGPDEASTGESDLSELTGNQLGALIDEHELTIDKKLKVDDKRAAVTEALADGRTD